MILNTKPVLFLFVVLQLFSCNKVEYLNNESGTLINNITVISANDKKTDDYLGYVVIHEEKIFMQIL